MTAGFWIGAAALTVLALAFLLVPLWREQRASGKAGLSGFVTALAIAPVAIGLYLAVTTFDPDAARPVASSDEMALLEQLAARLAANPEDVEGWALLGRSYRALGDYESARQAFEQAFNRTEAPEDGLKLAYAESMLFTDPSTAQSLAGDLIEEVLAASPGNQAALWLGGIVAGERGQSGVALQRFTALLATNPPAEIADIVRQQIVALGGSPGSAAPVPAAAAAGPVIDLEISLGEGVALDRFGPEARLYVLARAPDSPMPIVATQNALSALPGRFSLSDADAMVPGRSLSQFDTVTIVARISASGTATAQPGDVYGEMDIAPGSAETVHLVLDRIVPEG